MKRGLIGLCVSNKEALSEPEINVIGAGKFETLKWMSHTNIDVFKRVKDQYPEVEAIVRTYDGNIQNKYFQGGKGSQCPPVEYVNTLLPKVKEILTIYPDAIFQIHNEPNHIHRYEGWGQEEHLAEEFNIWFQQVIDLFYRELPDTRFCFPGLAVPHNDVVWVQKNIDAISKCHFLGVHTYWQNPQGNEGNHRNNNWGRRYQLYADIFTGMNRPIYPMLILEAGNSNHQNGYPFRENVIGEELRIWFEDLFNFDYVKAACPFIMSSDDPTWEYFSWVWGGQYRSWVDQIRTTLRRN